ncbi:hypothetical protein AB4Z21_27995, partial [Paenibacillus sp. MCAF20]
MTASRDAPIAIFASGHPFFYKRKPDQTNAKSDRGCCAVLSNPSNQGGKYMVLPNFKERKLYH